MCLHEELFLLCWDSFTDPSWEVKKLGSPECSKSSQLYLRETSALTRRVSILNTHWKDWCWSFNTLAIDAKSQLIGKNSDAGEDWGQEEKGATEDEIVGWHHRLNGHGFGWTLGVDGQGGLACWGSWGCKELDTTERLNWTELNRIHWTSHLGLEFFCLWEIFIY